MKTKVTFRKKPLDICWLKQIFMTIRYLAKWIIVWVIVQGIASLNCKMYLPSH